MYEDYSYIRWLTFASHLDEPSTYCKIFHLIRFRQKFEESVKVGALHNTHTSNENFGGKQMKSWLPLSSDSFPPGCQYLDNISLSYKIFSRFSFTSCWKTSNKTKVSEIWNSKNKAFNCLACNLLDHFPRTTFKGIISNSGNLTQYIPPAS